MSFKNPLILYAFLLLLIPVIIHLVRWKKYKKTEFTNVDFLKELEIKSRKSRRLKELIVLALRILAFAMLILAFAQPFLPSNARKNQITDSNNIIYLDNSLSLSALNGKTTLWQDLVQELQNLPAEETYTLITNDKVYKNIKGDYLHRLLYELTFSNRPTQHVEILKKIALFLKNDPGIQQNIIYISDLQNVYNESIDDSLFNPQAHYYVLNKSIKNLANISVDSLWIEEQNNENFRIAIQISATGKELESPVQISQGNEILWRSKLSFKDSLQQQITVQLPSKNLEAKVSVFDKAFQFDNDLYFSLQKPDKRNILIIGDKQAEFAYKIYTPDEFNLDNSRPAQVNYNKLKQYDLIIIYDYKSSFNLSGKLFAGYVEQYGNLAVIPGTSQAQDQENFLRELKISTSLTADTNRVFLNKINYKHPFFKGVFLKPVQNFAYPFVKQHFRYRKNSNWLYQLSDQSPFVQIFKRKGNVFLFNASFESENTNFTQAGNLIVPLFYQMAFVQNQKQKPYYILGKNNVFSLKKEIVADKTVKLKNMEEEFIPYQENHFDKLQIRTGELPRRAGIYKILYEDQKIGSVAFNYNRKENLLNFLQFIDKQNLTNINNVKNFVKAQENFYQDKHLWKWFLLSALLFLLIEMLVIRFWK